MSIHISSVFSLLFITSIIAEFVYKDAKLEKNSNVNLDWRCGGNVEREAIMGKSLESDIQYRNGLTNPKYHWPNGIIPFQILGSYSKSELDTIEESIHDFHTLTCISFTGRFKNETDYLGITRNPTGCNSFYGRQGGFQDLNLAEECFKKYIIIHELMHVIGFYHEHCRHDRDDHIKILWNNIIPNKTSQFNKLEGGNNFGADYTYESLMHYNVYADSKNGQPTMEPLIVGANLGNKIGFHRSDVQRINNMYNCPNRELPKEGWNNADIWVGIKLGNFNNN